MPFFGHTNILYMETGDGSAALAVAVVPSPGRVRRPELAARNNEVSVDIKKKKKKKKKSAIKGLSLM